MGVYGKAASAKSKGAQVMKKPGQKATVFKSKIGKPLLSTSKKAR